MCDVQRRTVKLELCARTRTLEEKNKHNTGRQLSAQLLLQKFEAQNGKVLQLS